MSHNTRNDWFCWECWFMRIAPRLHRRYLSWWLDRHRKLGSDETGAKPADVHAPLVAQPSGLTDSSPSSHEARHGVAQALADKVRGGLVSLRDGGASFAYCTDTSVIVEANASLDALLGLIDELADRLYESAATADRRQGTIDKLTRERNAAYPLIGALAIYGEDVNLEALVAKARELNQAVGAGE